jgi:hypothetical protein
MQTPTFQSKTSVYRLLDKFTAQPSNQSRSSLFSSFPAAAGAAPGVGTSTFSPSFGCSVKTTTNSGSSVERFLRTYLSECVLCVSKNGGHVISLPGPCANRIVVLFRGDICISPKNRGIGDLERSKKRKTYRSGWPSQKLMMGIVMPGMRP